MMATAKPMSVISSFQQIVDNAPLWKAQIAELATHAAQKHEEYAAEYQRLLHRAKARRKKSASVASIHSSDEEEQVLEQTEQRNEPLRSPRPSELVDINPLEAGNRFIYAQANRKRKPGTSIRSNASGPRQCRSKQMVVIYYDSRIQNELDKLVKGIGATRNNLRKGKNTYTASKGFLLPSLSGRYEAMDELVPIATSKFGPRLSKVSSDTNVVTATNPSTAEAAFTQTDKQLEAIQSLCETAAHQIIRDGDCKTELQDALGKLDLLATLAESTLELLISEQNQKDEEGAHLAESRSISDNTSTQSTLYEKPSIEAIGMATKPLSPVFEFDNHKRPSLPLTHPASNGPLSSQTIEVDDGEDDDDGSLDIPDIANYRVGGRTRVVA